MSFVTSTCTHVLLVVVLLSSERLLIQAQTCASVKPSTTSTTTLYDNQVMAFTLPTRTWNNIDNTYTSVTSAADWWIGGNRLEARLMCTPAYNNWMNFATSSMVYFSSYSAVVNNANPNGYPCIRNSVSTSTQFSSQSVSCSGLTLVVTCVPTVILYYRDGTSSCTVTYSVTAGGWISYKSPVPMGPWPQPAGNYCGSNKYCNSNACLGRCCSSSTYSANCASCSSSGSCGSCNSGYYITSSGTCAAKKSNGAACSSNTECSSGSCKGGNCCSASITNCADCDNAGTCAVCNTGYYVTTSYTCTAKAAAGEACSADVQCTSSYCRGGKCCYSSATASGCIACGLAGSCSTCATGYYLSSGACATQKSTGASCGSGSACLSGYCAGVCCASSAYAANCQTCSSTGTCTTCNSGYFVTTQNMCLVKVTSGGACSTNNMCASGTCFGGYCCGTSYSPNCIACNSRGVCQTCATGYYMTTSSTCAALLPAGSSCSSSFTCASGNCLGAYCCSSSASYCGTCSTAGLCASCTAGYTLSAGVCSPQQSVGSTCTSASQCSSGSCVGGRCCASVTYAFNCQTCSSTGSCSACASGYYLTSQGSCSPTTGSGSACSQNSACTSASCLGGYCCTSSLYSSYCASCNSLGSCRICSPGYYLTSSGTCATMLPGGSACSTSTVCQSQMCSGGYCCASTASNCLACGPGGSCASCVAGFYLSAGMCIVKGNAGSSCSTANQCGASVCLGGFCCSAQAGQIANCQSCNALGSCSACASGYYLTSGGYCNPEGSVGAPCASNTDCNSGACVGGFCCSSTVVSANCASCNAQGACQACLTGYHFSPSSVCIANLPAGSTCSGDAECSSQQCDGGFCCASNAGSACIACSSAGSCASCGASGYYTPANECLPRKPPGSSCSNSTECQSNACHGFYCCEDNSGSYCDTCSSQGKCAACTSGYSAVSGQCVSGSPNGQACLRSTDCVSANCADGVCAAAISTPAGDNSSAAVVGGAVGGMICCALAAGGFWWRRKRHGRGAMRPSQWSHKRVDVQNQQPNVEIASWPAERRVTMNPLNAKRSTTAFTPTQCMSEGASQQDDYGVAPAATNPTV